MDNKRKSTLLLALVGVLGLCLVIWQLSPTGHGHVSHNPATTVAQAPGTPQAGPGTPAPIGATTPNAQGGPGAALSGSGDPDEGFDNPPADSNATPTPANPVQGEFEDGKIKVMVGSPREFGNRIGDLVHIRVLMLADNSVQFDWNSLRQGVIGFNGSEFELAKDHPITVQTQPSKDGKSTLYVIDFQLQTFVITDPGVLFNLDLRYATGLAADSKTPNWQVLTTPDYLVTRSNTADNGSELLEGSLDAQAPISPWLMWPLLVGGFFLVGLWPGYLVVRWINRVRPGFKTPANEVAWSKFDKAIKDAHEFGFAPRHYKQISSALRVYLGVEPNTALEVGDRLNDHPKLDTIKSAIAKCDRVLYEQEELTDEENRALIKELEAVVPRPE